MRALRVTLAFGDYGPGDTITDKTEMKAALETNPGHVVAVNMPKPDKADDTADAPKKPAKADDAKPAPDTAAPASSPSTAS
jgi:hypothetical protein